MAEPLCPRNQPPMLDVVTLEGSVLESMPLGWLLAGRLDWPLVELAAGLEIVALAARREGLNADTPAQFATLLDRLDFRAQRGRKPHWEWDGRELKAAPESGRQAMRDLALAPEVTVKLSRKVRGWTGDRPAVITGVRIAAQVLPDARWKFVVCAANPVRSLDARASDRPPPAHALDERPPDDAILIDATGFSGDSLVEIISRIVEAERE
jgi:hypothetical protein